MVKFKIFLHLGLISSLLLPPVTALASGCRAEDSPLETHYVIDPSQKRINLYSVKDFSGLEVSKCSGENSNYLKVAIANLFYDGEIRADEFLSTQKYESSCQIISEIPLQKLSVEQEIQTRNERQLFIQKCLAVIVSESRGKIIEYPKNQTFCRVIERDNTKSELYLEGPFCHIKTNPSQTYQFKIAVKPECLDQNFLNQAGIYSKDIESRLILRETPDASGRGGDNSIQSRDVRFTILPPAKTLPLIRSEEGQSFDFSSVLATNVHQGPVVIRGVGTRLSQIEVGYLAENLAEKVCVQGPKAGCTSASDYNTPLVARVEMNELDNKQRIQIASWSSPFRLPPQWSGLVNPLFNINYGSPTSQIVINQTFQEGKIYEVVSEFFEPAAYMDALSYDIGFHDPNYLAELGQGGNGESLQKIPTLPTINLTAVLPKLPQVNLGAGLSEIAFWNFRVGNDLTHAYDRICDRKNEHCEKTLGIDKPFARIVTQFKIGKKLPSGQFEILDISTARTSKTFGSYQKSLSQFPARTCLAPK